MERNGLRREERLETKGRGRLLVLGAGVGGLKGPMMVARPRPSLGGVCDGKRPRACAV